MRFGVQGKKGMQYFDVAQGPDIGEYGPTYEVPTKSDYRYIVGARVAGAPNPDDPKRPLLDYRSPLSVLGIAIQQSIEHGMSLPAVLGSTNLEGDFLGGSFGRTEMYGPPHGEAVRQEMARRITIGAKPGAYIEDVVAEIERRKKAKVGQWSHLQEYFPHKSDDNVIRMLHQPWVSGGSMDLEGKIAERVGGTGLYPSLRGAPDKDIKSRNVTYDYRENVGLWGVTRAPIIEQNPNSPFFGKQIGRGRPKLSPLAAPPLSEVGRSSEPQWATSNVVLPGETQPRPSIMLNEFIGAVPFSSGAAAIYPNLLAKLGAHSARRMGKETIQLPFESVEEFESATFKMNKGVFGKTITAGSTKQVGVIEYMRKVPGEEGVTYEPATYPINITAESADVSLTRAKLLIPRGFDPETGVGTGMSPYDPKTGYGMKGVESTQPMLSRMAPTLKGRSLGIQRSTEGGFFLQIGTAKTVTPSLKTGAGKSGTLLLAGLEGYEGRTATIAGEQVHIDLYNPEVKAMEPRMIAAWGAMDTDQQRLLATYYDVSLGQFMAGQEGPVSWDKLSAYAGLTPYELAEQMLAKVTDPKLSKKDQNAIMRNFGIGVGEVTVPMMLDKDMAAYYEDYVTRGAEKLNLNPGDLIGKDKFINFTPLTEGSRAGDVLMEVKSRGIFMRTASQYVPEDAGGSVMNYEMMRAMRSKYSSAVELIGLGAEQGPKAAKPSTRALRQIMETTSYLNSDLGKPTANLINPERAGQLLSLINVIDPGLQGKDRLKAMTKILGKKILRFETLSGLGRGHMFSPHAAKNIESEVMGTSITGMAEAYENTIVEMLQAEMLGDPQAAEHHITSNPYSPYIDMTNRMRRMTGQDRLGKASKAASSGREVQGAIGGKYAALPDLKPDEVYIGDDQLNRMLKDMGVKGAKELTALKDEITERGYMPAFFVRQPLISSEFGAPAVKLVTRDILARRGIHVPKPSVGRGEGDATTTGIAGFVPTNIYQQLAGDLDYDPNAIIPIAKFDRKKRRMVYGDEIDEKLKADLSRSSAAVLKDARRSIERQFAGQFDVVADSVEDALLAYTQENQYPFKNNTVEWRPVGKLQEEAERLLKNTMGMGTSYSARRRLEAAAEVLGTFEKGDIINNLDQMSKLYQQYLDKTRGSLTNLETMYNTASLSVTQGGDLRMYGKANAQGEWLDFSVGGGPQATNQMGNQMIAAMTKDYLSKTEPLQKGSLAFMLSSGSQDIGRLQKIIEDNQTSGHAALTLALQGAVGDITKTPLGLSMMSTAVSRAMKKQDKDGVYRRDKIGNTLIPFAGKEYTLQDLAMQDEIMNTRSLYTVFSGSRTLLPEEINKLAGLAKKSEAAQHVLSQFSDWDTLQAQRVASASDEIVQMRRTELLENRPIQMYLSSLYKISQAKPEEIYSPKKSIDFNEFALARTSLQHIGPQFRGVFYQESEDLTRGNDVEAAFAALGGTKKKFGYHVGQGAALRLDATTDEGRLVQLVGKPDFVKVGKKGITITDVKSSGRTIEDLAKDPGYMTQVRGYAQMMSALAQESEGRQHLREVFREWDMTEEDLAKAIGFAREGKIKGQLYVFGEDQTAKKVAEGAKGTRIKYGDMYEEGIGQYMMTGADKVIQGLRGSLDFLQQLANLGRPVAFGNGTLTIGQSAGSIGGIVADARKILEGRGMNEAPLRVLENPYAYHAKDKWNPLGTGAQAGEHKINREETVVNPATGQDAITVNVPPGSQANVQPTASQEEQPSLQQHSATTGLSMADLDAIAQKLGGQKDAMRYNYIDPVTAKATTMAGLGGITGIVGYSWLPGQVKQSLADVMQIRDAGSMSFDEVLAKAMGATGGDPATRSEITKALRGYGPQLRAAEKMQRRIAQGAAALKHSGVSETWGDVYKEYAEGGPSEIGQARETASQLASVYKVGADVGAFGSLKDFEGSIKDVTERLKALRTEVKDATDQVKEANQTGWSPERTRAQQVGQAKQRLAIQQAEYKKLEDKFAETVAAGGTPGEIEDAEMRAIRKAVQIQNTQTRIQNLEESPIRRGGRDLGRGLRRMLGGFGLMYLGSMFGFGAGDYQYGTQEGEMLRGQLYQAQMAYGSGDAQQLVANAQLQAAMGQGLVGRQMALSSAAMRATGMSDFIGTAKTGLGFFAGASFIGSSMGGATGAAISAAAPLIGGAGALGALAYQGYAYSQNMPSLYGVGAAAAENNDTFGIALNKLQQGMGQTNADLLNGFISGLTGGKVQGGFQAPTEPPGYRTRITQDQMREFLYGENNTVWSPGTPQEELSMFTGIVGLDRFSNYNPELVQAEAQDLYFRGEGYSATTADDLETLVRQGAAGIDSRAIGNALLDATRRRGQISLTQARLLLGTNPQTAEQYGRAAGVLGQLSGRTVGGLGTFQQQIDAGAGELFDLSQTDNWQLYRQADVLNMQSGLRGLSYQMPTAGDLTGISPSQQSDTMLQTQMQNQGIGLFDQGRMMGMSYGQAYTMMNSAMQSPQAMRLTEQLMNYNPTAMAYVGAAGVSGYNNMQTRQVRQTYDAMGNEMGLASLPAFTMDMGLGTWSSGTVANMVWGQNWDQDDPYGLRAAAVSGGFRGMQSSYRQQAANLSAAGAGIAMRGAELSYAFQTGIGLQGYGTVNPVTGQAFNLPSGGFWGLQDQQRDLANRQQMWNFQYQQQSMDMQRSQFYDNRALQYRGMQMNRAFTRRGWEYEDQVSALQWGWQQEDYAEESRFLTGRSRRKAETQMDRATIMHELQTERKEEVRSQQEELWDLEDERFNMTREHFEEQMDLQEENFDKMQEFYAERKKLEDEMQELQRAYFIEQNKLQKESAGLQAAQAALQREMAEEQEKMNQFLEDQQGRLELNRTTWKDIGDILLEVAKKMADILDMDIPDNDPITGNEPIELPIDTPPPPQSPTAWGTQGYKVVPGLPGQSYPITLHGGEIYDVKRRDEISNPWNDEVIPINNTRNRGTNITQSIIVRIGEREIRDYIVDTVNMEM